VQGLADQHIGALGRLDERVAALRVTGEDDRLAARLDTKAEGRDDGTVIDLESADGDLADGRDVRHGRRCRRLVHDDLDGVP